MPGLIRSGSRSDTTEYAYIYCENHWFWAKGGQQVLFTLHTSTPALVAQRIEHLTTDQKVRGSNPFKRTQEIRSIPNDSYSFTEINGEIDIQSDIPTASASADLQRAVNPHSGKEIVSCDTDGLLISMTTNGSDKRSLQPSTGPGSLESEKKHVPQSSKRSSAANNQRGSRLAKSVSLDDEETDQKRRVNNDHNSTKSKSKSRSVEDLRGSSREKRSQAQRVKPRSKGGATLRPDGRWQASLDLGKFPNGKRNRKFFYGKTQREALAKRDRAKAALIYGVVNIDDSTTFLDFATTFLRDTAVLTCKPTTVTGYEDLLKHHAYPRIGHMRLQAIRAAHIDNLMSEMKRSGSAVGTLRAVRRVVSTVLRHAERNDLILSNPVRKTKVPKLLDGDKYRKPVPYTKEQIDVLLELLPTSQYGTLWKFLLWTGMRRGEALALKWSDLVEADGQWSATVTKQLKEARLNSSDGISTVSRVIAGPKTKAGIREVPLDIQMYKELQQLKMKMVVNGNLVREGDYIFQTSTGEPYFPSNVTKAWTSFLKKNRLRHIPLHGLRHTFATVALSEGAPLESVSEALGHSSIKITKDIYASRVPGLSRKATEAMRKVMNPSQSSIESKEFNPMGVRGLNGWDRKA